MGVEVRAQSVLCNIQCLYCYEHPQRDAGNVSRSYDLVKIKNAVETEGSHFTLFGGEPLLMPLKDLEDLWSWGFDRFGRNSLQTNGSLITEEHIRLFHKYKVHIGMSLDGPGELNDVRWNGSVKATRDSTSKSQAALERLCHEGLIPSLIITLHRGNATSEKLPGMFAWIRQIYTLGVRRIRLHLLESENSLVRERLGLTTEENILALRSFLEVQGQLPSLQFDLFDEMRAMLRGRDKQVACVWTGCDPYTTRAVRGIEGNGQRSNCSRTCKDGIDFAKAGREGFERYIALYYTAHQDGGCKGCRFFLMCKGQCPGTAIDGDWRNRTEHCEVLQAIFGILEKELLANGKEPLSLSTIRPKLELLALEEWAEQRNPRLFQLLERVKE